MTTEQEVNAVLSKFNNLLSRDGGKLTLKQIEGDQLVVDYVIGVNDCPDCVMRPDDLGAMIGEALPASVRQLQVTILAHEPGSAASSEAPS